MPGKLGFPVSTGSDARSVVPPPRSLAIVSVPPAACRDFVARAVRPRDNASEQVLTPLSNQAPAYLQAQSAT
jgi:hypothetical protein